MLPEACDELPERRKNAFTSAVLATAEALEQGQELPAEILHALLQDPGATLIDLGVPQPPIKTKYERLTLDWNSLGKIPVAGLGVACDATHEVSQTLIRRLSFDRHRCYRIHCLRLNGACIENVNADLIAWALARESAARLDDSLHISNVGGWHSRQDLFASGQAAAETLRGIISSCLETVVIADEEEVTSRGEDALPPFTLADESLPDGWINVSRYGSLNYLHNHADATVAVVYYAKVSPNSGGSLLLRITPGSGVGMGEPDEDMHVPRMWLAGSEESHGERQGVVRFAEIEPESGMLLVFPGWLSHSVSPFLGHTPRISFASNWTLPYVSEEEEQLEQETFEDDSDAHSSET